MSGSNITKQLKNLDGRRINFLRGFIDLLLNTRFIRLPDRKRRKKKTKQQSHDDHDLSL